MFVHLHTHSYYSFLDGVPSPQALVDAAIQYGMPALALTDHHGLTGSVEFYEACQEAGVQPILGLELGVQHRFGLGSLVLLAMDQTGWSSLCRLSSAVQTANHRDPTLGIPVEILAENTAGLLCLSGGKRGLVQHLLQRQQRQQAQEFLAELGDLFPERFYVELQRQQSFDGPTSSRRPFGRISPSDVEITNALASVADALHVPVVATNNVHYLKAYDAGLQRTLSAMRLNCRLSDLPPDAVAPQGCEFASADEMKARFADRPEAVANTGEIAQRCRLELPLGKPHYPEIPLLRDVSPRDRLHERAYAGAKERYGELNVTIKDRLEHELKVIGDRGYAPLFLIMSEIMDYARRDGVPTASRGSAGSSLVAYCLKITTPDPLALNLYFERFLNPARSNPPDIDTDLCSKRRGGVIAHVYERYGHDRVAMVATINRFRRRSALREVAKAHELPAKTIRDITAELPYRSWRPGSRSEPGDKAPFGELENRYPEHKAVLQQAGAILNFPRHLSVHPGGVVITPGALTDLVPTHLASKGMIITQFDHQIVERFGLVKIDLLGTRGLSVLGDVAERVYSWRRREFKGSLDVLDQIPHDNPDTARLIRDADTIGCFGIESPGMRATLKEIDAHSPEDLMIALALYRPGPLTGGLKDAFVRRHLGQEPVEHIHPALTTLLAGTHGVILYQEQVLRIASELAGLSLADADILRRAMSHFDPGERMKTLKARFIAGAEEISSVQRETGERIWEMMAAFAGYGFPKAHAASYAQVAWRSAWCKAHYPAAFMAAVLANGGGYYRQRVYLNEARRLGVPISPPHINHADWQFSVTYPKGVPTLYMGLDQVRELTRRTQRRIIQERPFHSLTDFLARVDPRREEVENLIKVGALAGLGSIPQLLAQLEVSQWSYRQPPLFEGEMPGEVADWDLSARVGAQVAILGIGVDAHPLELFADHLGNLDVVTTVEALQKKGETIRVAGVRQTVQRFHTSGGEAFYILELEDLGGVLKVHLTPEQRRQHQSVLYSYEPILVEGEVDFTHNSGEPMLRLKKMWGANL
jgi:DNA-directed DNA polymerase III PolC